MNAINLSREERRMTRRHLAKKFKEGTWQPATLLGPRWRTSNRIIIPAGHFLPLKGFSLHIDWVSLAFG